jgi:glycerophosphoryl diester phosphodiesterase
MDAHSGSDRIQVLGHRGSREAGLLENSVAAVVEAQLRGADGFEVDVQLTADGALVCAHDSFVFTVKGQRLAVEQTACTDLVVTGGRLATLTQVLDAAQHAVGAHVIVEAKPVSDPELAAKTATTLAKVLRRSAGNARITVSSFDPALLALIRAACADLPIRTALLGDREVPATDIVERAAADGHDEVHLPLVGVRRAPHVVELARSLGLSVTLWTVNHRADLRWVADLGVDAVITDDVLTAWSELDRAATEDAEPVFAA